MDKLYQIIKSFLKISHNEARGIFSLLIVCVIALVLLFFPQIVVRQNSTIKPSDIKQLDSLVAILESRDLPNVNHALFLFDPNSISFDSLLLLGFPKKVAEILINYRSKGGKFYIKKDVKKIYGISDLLMEDIYAFINLPDSIFGGREKKIAQNFDLNTATIDQYKKVNMIGDAFASRILKYRNLLGGFVNKDQLEEVYGLSGVALLNLKNSSFIRAEFKPRLIKINHDDVETLRNHPYISGMLAEDILRFREINSIIESEKVLAGFKSLDKSIFEKLILYLDFN